MEKVLVDVADLGDGDGFDDVSGVGAQGVGAGGAVGNVGDVDAGGGGLRAPVLVVALEGGAGGAVGLLEDEGAGAVADGVDGAVGGAGVGGRGQDDELGTGEALRHEGVGGRGGQEEVLAVGLRGELDSVQDARRLGGGGGEGEGGGRVLGAQGGAVVEGDALAQGESPGGLALALPGGGEQLLGIAVGVEPGEALGAGPPSELEAIVGEWVELALRGVEHGQADAAVARGAARAGGDGGSAGSDAEGGEDLAAGDGGGGQRHGYSFGPVSGCQRSGRASAGCCGRQGGNGVAQGAGGRVAGSGEDVVHGGVLDNGAIVHDQCAPTDTGDGGQVVRHHQ